jgi:hypothetical protein
MVVNKEGKPEQIKGPEGETNAIPTPRSLEEMKRIVNLKVTPAPALAPALAPEPTPAAAPEPTLEPMTLNTPPPTKSKTPEGIVYTPYPPAAAQRGGGLLSALEVIANISLPAAALGTAAVLSRRCTKRSKRSTKRRT